MPVRPEGAFEERLEPSAAPNPLLLALDGPFPGGCFWDMVICNGKEKDEGAFGVCIDRFEDCVVLCDFSYYDNSDITLFWVRAGWNIWLVDFPTIVRFLMGFFYWRGFRSSVSLSFIFMC